MKDSGLTRPVDKVGRIVIPKEIREAFDIRMGDSISFWVDRENEIICLRPQNPACLRCGSKEDLRLVKEGVFLCRACVETLL